MEIAGRLVSGTDVAVSLEPVAWWHYRAADDVLVSVRADVAPWRLRQIRAYLGQMISSLRKEEGKE